MRRELYEPFNNPMNSPSGMVVRWEIPPSISGGRTVDTFNKELQARLSWIRQPGILAEHPPAHLLLVESRQGEWTLLGFAYSRQWKLRLTIYSGWNPVGFVAMWRK